MHTIYSSLASTIRSAASTKGQDGRLLVGIAGPPGCGKSTIAAEVVRLLNNQVTCNTPDSIGILGPAIAISIDGFHLTRKQLEFLPDPINARVRRGAPFTFDVEAILDFVQTLRSSANLPPTTRPTITAPSFDHSIKDPVENDITILPTDSIIILEGNYLLLNEPKWCDISKAFDLCHFVNVDPMLARQRVASRHVASGIELTLEDGERRFDSNDALNGELVREKIVRCDVMVDSVDVPV